MSLETCAICGYIDRGLRAANVERAHFWLLCAVDTYMLLFGVL